MTGKLLSVLFAALLVTGCKFTLNVSEGGNVTSMTGDNDCGESQTCMVEAAPGEPFAETWTANPNPGYLFAGWGPNLCKNQVGPCALNLPGEFTEFDLNVPLDAPFVEPEPMHFLYSQWGLGAGPNVASLVYGFLQADVRELNEAGNALATSNQCLVASFYLSQPVPIPLPGIVTTGGCVENAAVLLPDEGPFAFYFSETTVDATEVAERSLPVYLTRLYAEKNRVSVSMANTGTSNNQTGFESKSYLNTYVAARSQNMTVDRIAGEWLLTRMELQLVPTKELLYTIAGIPATISTQNGGSLSLDSNKQSYEIEYRQFMDASPLREFYFGDIPVDDLSFPLTVTPDGELTFTPPEQVLDGFVTPSADLFVAAEGVPSLYDLRNGDPNILIPGAASGHQLMVGIKPNPAPDILGKRYQLDGIVYQISNDQIELFRWVDGAFIAFNSPAMARWRFKNEGNRVKLANAGGQGLQPFSDSLLLMPAYSVQGNGRIQLSLAGVEGVDKSLITGFATMDNRMLVFAHGIQLDGGQQAQIGFWIGTCTNCD
jgi:hypothetical protein